jgi:hypothetical protein
VKGVEMRRSLLIVSMLLVVATLVSAQPGRIQLTADQAITTCDITDAGGLIDVYVFHINTSGANASQFMIDVIGAHTMTYLAETVTPPFLKIGVCAGPDKTGCAIAYGSCQPGNMQILKVQYLGFGTTPACTEFVIVADPSADPPDIYATDCANPPILLSALGSTAVINPDGTCPCPEIIPVEETSWGKIKAIYR